MLSIPILIYRKCSYLKNNASGSKDVLSKINSPLRFNYKVLAIFI